MTDSPYDSDDQLPAGRCSIIHCYDVLIVGGSTDAGHDGGAPPESLAPRDETKKSGCSGQRRIAV